MRLRHLLAAALLFFSWNSWSQTQPSGTKKTADIDYLQEAAKVSVFVYDPSPKPCEPLTPGVRAVPLGSAFIIGIADATSPPDAPRSWEYLITAEHVVHGKSDVVLRFNRLEGRGKVCMDLHLERGGPNQNLFAPSDDSTDVVAIFLAKTPDDAELLSISYSWITDKDDLKKYELKVGTGVFTVGYLLGYAGESRNYPVTKFGKISVLTDEKWLLSERGGYENAYIVELQNVPGLSGAPLMAYGQEFKMDPLRFRSLPPLLIGVVKDLLWVQDAKTKTRISQGLAAIEPGYKVKALMDEIVARIRAVGGKPNLDFNRIPMS